MSLRAMRGVWRSAAALALTLLMTAPGFAQTQPGMYPTKCAGCHQAPPMMPSPASLSGHHLILQNFSDRAHLGSVITNGSSSPDGNGGTWTMAPVAGLSSTDIDQIYAYLVAVRDGDLDKVALDFSTGTVLGFGSAYQEVVVTNRRGTATTITTLGVPTNFTRRNDPAGFPGDCQLNSALAPSASCTIAIAHTPGSLSTPGTQIGNLTIRLGADNGLSPSSLQSRTVNLSGLAVTPPQLAISTPATTSGTPFLFNAAVGVQTAPQSWTLSNSGGAPLTLTGIATTSGDFLLGGTCAVGTVLPDLVTPAPTCTVEVSYKSLVESESTAEITITNSTGTTGRIYVKGKATGTPSVQLGSFTIPTTLVGHPVDGSLAVSNIGNGATTVGAASASPTGTFDVLAGGCNGVTLPPVTGTCSVGVRFTPPSTPGPQTGSLTLPYAPPSGSSKTASLGASALALSTSVAPTTPLVVMPNGSTTATVTLTNPSGVGTFLASPITLSGSAYFQLTSTTCGSTLAAGAACNVVVTFHPTASLSTAVTTDVTVKYGPQASQNTAQTVVATMTGSTQPVPVLLAAPNPLIFPATLPGASSVRSVDVSNTGNATLTLGSISLANNTPPDFAITGNTCVGASIAQGGAPCKVTVTFTPSTNLPRTAQLVIAHNATGSPTSVTLKGSTLLRAIVSLSPTSLDFGSVMLGTPSATKSSVLTNTGNKSLKITSVSLAGAQPGDYSQVGSTCVANATVAPAASCTVTLRFTPSALGARTASVQIVHDATGSASPSTIGLSGTGTAVPTPDIQTNLTSLSFAPTTVQTASAPQTVTVLNAGTANLVFSRIAPTGAAAADFSTGGSCAVGTPLAPAASCSVAVAFTPTAVGARTAQLSLESNASSGTVTLALSGTGAAAPAPVLSLSPATELAFGPQTLGGLYADRRVTLTNTGSAPLHIAAIVVSGAGFTGTHDCPATLAVNDVCTASIAFAPTAVGAHYEGSLSISSDAAGSPQAVKLSGDGVAAAVPVVAWDPAAAALSFGDVAAGASSALQSLQLANHGPGGVRLNIVNAVGAQSADFSVTGTCLPGTDLAQDATCRIDVRFVPGSAGAKAATLQVVTTGTPLPAVELGGNGVGGPSAQLALSASTLAFETVRVGNPSAPVELALSSTGSGALAVQAIDVAGPYVIQGTTCPALPFTLAVGSECRLALVFAPQAAGPAAGAVSITSNASPALQEVALTGQAEPKADVSGGGCTLVAAGRSGVDPLLWLLTALAAAALWQRRRQRAAQAEEATGASGSAEAASAAQAARNPRREA